MCKEDLLLEPIECINKERRKEEKKKSVIATGFKRGEMWKNGKGLFGWNGSVLFGDRSYCKKRVLAVLKRKETGHLYGGTERNRSNRTGPKLVGNSLCQLKDRPEEISPHPRTPKKSRNSANSEETH